MVSSVPSPTAAHTQAEVKTPQTRLLYYCFDLLLSGRNICRAGMKVTIFVHSLPDMQSVQYLFTSFQAAQIDALRKKALRTCSVYPTALDHRVHHLTKTVLCPDPLPCLPAMHWPVPTPGLWGDWPCPPKFAPHDCEITGGRQVHQASPGGLPCPQRQPRSAPDWRQYDPPQSRAPGRIIFDGDLQSAHACSSDNGRRHLMLQCQDIVLCLACQRMRR